MEYIIILLLKSCCQLTGGKLLSERFCIRMTVGITVEWTCELFSTEQYRKTIGKHLET